MSPRTSNHGVPDVATLLAESGRSARAADEPSIELRPEFADGLSADLRSRLVARKTTAVMGSAVSPRRLAALRSFAAPRLLAAGVAAVLVAAALYYGSGLLAPSRIQATADQAAAATLIRGGISTALVAGTELRAGDEIHVAAGGGATLRVGDGYTRMAGDSDLAIVGLDPNAAVIDQIHGRVYHRVDVPSGVGYEVRTGSVGWTAHGTAFDLDREATAGADRVTGLALVDAVAVNGPRLQTSLPQGSSLTLDLGPNGLPGAGSSEPEPIDTSEHADPWLARNASLDAELGLNLGWLTSAPPPSPRLRVPLLLRRLQAPRRRRAPRRRCRPLPHPAGPPPSRGRRSIRRRRRRRSRLPRRGRRPLQRPCPCPRLHPRPRPRPSRTWALSGRPTIST